MNVFEQSKIELTTEKPVSIEEMKLINELVEIRNVSRKLSSKLDFIENELKAVTKSETIADLAFIIGCEVIDFNASELNPDDYIGFPMI